MSSAVDLVLVPVWAVRDRHAIVRWLPGAPHLGPSESHLVGCRGEIIVDRATCMVLVDGQEVILNTSAFLFLESLLASDGEPHTMAELAHMLWGDAERTQSSSLRAIAHDVRRALGRHAAHVRCVRTVGYRWDNDGTVCSEPESVQESEHAARAAG